MSQRRNLRPAWLTFLFGNLFPVLLLFLFAAWMFAFFSLNPSNSRFLWVYACEVVWSANPVLASEKPLQPLESSFPIFNKDLFCTCCFYSMCSGLFCMKSQPTSILCVLTCRILSYYCNCFALFLPISLHGKSGILCSLSWCFLEG